MSSGIRCRRSACEVLGRTECCYECEHGGWCMLRCEDGVCRAEQLRYWNSVGMDALAEHFRKQERPITRQT